MKLRLTEVKRWRVSEVVFLAVLFSLVGASTPFARIAAISFDPGLGIPVDMLPQHDSWTKSSEVRFRWSEVPGAVSYELRYVRADNCVGGPNSTTLMYDIPFTTPDTETVTVAETVKEVGGFTDGIWCWQVRVMSGFGLPGTWSEPHKLKVDTQEPIVDVKLPLKLPNITGNVDTSTTSLTLLVDGEPKTDIPIRLSSAPNDKGKFEWSLVLLKDLYDDHTLAIRAVDLAGNEKTVTVTTTNTESLTPSTVTIDTAKSPTLPLVVQEPLTLVVAPPSFAATDDIVPPAVVDSGVAAKTIDAPARIETLASARIAPYVIPLQATNHGWAVFGVAWYWWALGGSMGVGAWTLLARARLSARLG